MPIFNTEYKSYWEFKPWANTLAYYKFDWNLNDSSTNWHNLSLYTGSAAYWTASWWWTYVHFNQNTWANYWTLSWFNYDWNHTISLWLNPQTNFGTSWNNCLFELRESSSYAFVRFCANVAVSYWFSPAFTQALSVWIWYNMIYTRSWNSAKMYINWTLVNSWTAPITWRTNQTIRFRLNQIGDTNSSSYANNAYYSDVIFESKEWSAQEVSDYYNQTKSNYWL